MRLASPYVALQPQGHASIAFLARVGKSIAAADETMVIGSVERLYGSAGLRVRQGRPGVM